MTDIAEDHALVLAGILEEPLHSVTAIEDILQSLVDAGLAYLAADGYRATEKDASPSSAPSDTPISPPTDFQPSPTVAWGSS